MWSWRSEGAGLKTEADLIVAEQLVILLAEGVFRLRQDLDEILLAEAVKRCNDGQTADQLGNDAEFQQIVRLNELEELAHVAVSLALDRRVKADGRLVGALLDDLVQSVKRTAADEQNVRCVDLDEFLLGVLAPALRRNVRDRTLKDLQKRLLHTPQAHLL